MAGLTCSVCNGELVKLGKMLRCNKCGREKPFDSRDENVHEVDMNEDTKDLDVLME